MNTDSIALYDVNASNLTKHYKQMLTNQNAFLLCTQGEVHAAIDGNRYKLHSGDLLILPSYVNTAIEFFTPDMQGVCGMADFELVLKALETVSNTRNLTNIRNYPLISLTEEQYKRINRMVDIVRIRRTEQSMFSEQIVLALIQVLLFEIMDAYNSNLPTEDSDSRSRADMVFLRFLTELAAHFRDQREVNFYASKLNLTPRYFASIIKAKSGISPVAWIARYVVAEAKTLLSNQDMSIKEIAMRLNFPNQSFFGRYFKQHTGTAPGEYRRGLAEN